MAELVRPETITDERGRVWRSYWSITVQARRRTAFPGQEDVVFVHCDEEARTALEAEERLRQLMEPEHAFAVVKTVLAMSPSGWE